MYASYNLYQKILWGLAAVTLLLLVLAFGAFSGLQGSKRQFETEAQNVVASLQSSVSLADGLSHSFDALEFFTSDEGDPLAKKVFSSAMAKYN